MSHLYLFGGLFVLLISGELLVRGALLLAHHFRISVLVTGLIVVALGTSLPELIVCIKAALNNFPDIATGNIIGSNIANIALILGITAIIYPVSVNRGYIRSEWAVMMGSTIALFLVMLDRKILPLEGILLLIAILIYIIFLIRKSFRDFLEDKKTNVNTRAKTGLLILLLNIIFIPAGSIGLIYGADWFVTGAAGIAEHLGISQRIIGLTMVAVGTSLPELVTTIMAALKKQSDLIIGNLLGSNIINILLIGGITSIIRTIRVNESILHFDIIWLLGVSLILLPMMLFSKKITGSMGVLLLIIYAIYLFSISV